MYEKTSADVENWTESGVLRKDNTIFYFIGDYTKAWLFSKGQLRNLCVNHERNKFKKVETPTSIGVLLPIEYIQEHKDVPLMEFNFGR